MLRGGHRHVPGHLRLQHQLRGGGRRNLQGTFTASVIGLNPAGAIAGAYTDSGFFLHGYVRNKQGAITTFDVPAAGTGAFQGTLPESINPSGAITGQYLDASGVNHGFLRDKHGVITTFDARGAGTGAGQGTFRRRTTRRTRSPDTTWTRTPRFTGS